MQNITPRESFIARVKERYGDAFSFEKLSYINNKTPVTLTCKKHGDIVFFPGNLFKKSAKGCPYCSGVKMHVLDFLEKSKAKHGDKYDYSQVEFINSTVPVKVICPEHGPFFPRPIAHASGTKCNVCSMLGQRLPMATFVERSEELFGDTYDLSRVQFEVTDDMITVGCKKHGFFTKRVSSYLEGYGCKKCSDEDMMLGKEDFLFKAREVFGDTYDYSKVDYKGSKVNVTIICPEHGPFEKRPNSHITAKSGCPTCRESKGEREVRLYLEREGIKYTPEYKIPNHLYRWDFYLPEHNLMIEFHGKQHYVPVEQFGGLQGHLGTVQRDKEKLALVKELGKTQLTISCFEKKSVEVILDEYFGKG